jgi:hypothetical protein
VPLEILPRQEGRVGIAQLGQQAVRRFAVELRLRDRVHVVVADVGQDVLEESGLLVDVSASLELPLEKPAGAEAGDHRDRREDLAPSGHGKPW